ncbi:MAG: PAS-domain containing protein [Holosporaceae bacterium]|jgi:signal transduction histidine kinase/transcriptional regulator with PAS, ATPase and Fis domain|nr:PAS-domain containing protein [Holosporaceae bacterium]
MQTWFKIDLAGLLAVIFGIIFFFSNSHMLTSISLLIASLLLLRSLYTARYEAMKYRELLCHYQSVLSSSTDGWIAWNTKGNYIGSSKKLKVCFGIKQTPIHMSDILSAVDPSNADELSLHLGTLKKQGSSFKLIVKTLQNNNKIEISGSHMIINNIETILLWCSNITVSTTLIDSLEKKLISTRNKVDSLCKALDTLPIPVWIHNKKMEIIYCNKTYSDYLDASVDKIISENLPLIPGNLFGQGHSLAENAKKCNRIQSISQSIVVNAARKKISIHEVPLPDESLVGYVRDITVEESLTENLDRVITANYEVLENISTAIVIFGENTRVVFSNNAYQRIMGLEANWLRSKPTFSEVLDELRNNRQLSEQADYQAFKKSQLALFTSITSPIQELVHLPNGKTLRLVIAPYPLGGLLFMYEDVTDSLTLQRKNNTLLAVQKETLDNLYEGIMVYGSNNRMKIINKSALKIWHFGDKSSLKGMHVSETLEHIKDELDYGNDWAAFREHTISNLTDRIVKTGKLLKKDGSVILFTYIPLPDGAHMHSFIDITDTCVVERAILEKNQALKTAQELRVEFVSGISTELKEPLNVLIGFAELLTHQYFGTLNDKQLEYCQCILSASNQLHQLTNDLLEMVSIDIDSVHLDISSFVVEDAIDEVICNLNKRINEKSIDVVKNYPEEKTVFNGDKIRIKQSIYNVLTNAIQFTPPNGKIDLRVARDEKCLKIIIKDKGVGCSQNQPKRIFQRSKVPIFFDVNNDKGISMPFVRSLIELHGGSLKITSDVGEGTCVICSLPINGIPQQSFNEGNNIILENTKEAANS